MATPETQFKSANRAMGLTIALPPPRNNTPIPSGFCEAATGDKGFIWGTNGTQMGQ